LLIRGEVGGESEGVLTCIGGRREVVPGRAFRSIRSNGAVRAVVAATNGARVNATLLTMGLGGEWRLVEAVRQPGVKETGGSRVKKLMGLLIGAGAKNGGALEVPIVEQLEDTGTGVAVVSVPDKGAGTAVGGAMIRGIHGYTQFIRRHAIGPGGKDAEEGLEHREEHPSVLAGRCGRSVPGLLEGEAVSEDHGPVLEFLAKDGDTGVGNFGAIGGCVQEPAQVGEELVGLGARDTGGR
jgi:hypothetical protein